MGRIASKKIARASLFFLLLLAAGGLAEQVTWASRTGEGQIAYLRNGDIYLFDLATKHTTQITRRGDIGNFAWSPYHNGQQIAFETESGTSSDIYTMNADGTDIKPAAVTLYDEMSPAYADNGTLYYVQHFIAVDLPENRIMEHDAANAANPNAQDQQLYQEPGGFCHITDLTLVAAPFALVSRDCGRGKNVSVTDITTGKDTPIGNDKCLLGAVWAHDGGPIAAIQTDCQVDTTTAQIATFNPNGTRLGLQDTPDKGFGSIDWVPGETGFFTDLVYGNEGGLWLISNTGGTTRISSVGGPPRWRPGSESQLPSSTGSESALPGMPSTGQAQANDLLAWGALVACIAIAAGLVLLSRRRKDRDGL